MSGSGAKTRGQLESGESGLRAAGNDEPNSITDRYLAYLEHSRRLSAYTRSSYASDLEVLRAILAGIPFDQATSQQIRSAVARLHSHNESPRTLARRLSAWRAFYAWLVRFDGLPANPVVGIRAPKIPKHLPTVLSPDGMAQLLDRTPVDALEVRDRAMFELFYSSGLRLSELCSLSLDDGRTVLRDSEVTVTGKGAKTRTVPVGRRALDALREWMKLRSGFARANEVALFVGARGDRIHGSVVQTRLKRWGVASGVGAGLHPHVLRHSFATHVLQSSSDLRAVQDMLGHASISTTQVYTHLDFQHLAKVYDAAHPRAHKKK